MDLTDLETFVLVAEAGSFTQAGKELGVPTSTVSRRVSRLEEQMKLSLFHRNGRFFKLTKVGELVAKRCKPALQELAEINKSLLDQDDTPRGPVSLTMSTEMGGSLELAILLKDFREQYPGVQLSVEVTNRFVDLIEENVDVALRIHSGTLSDSSALMMKRLVTMEAGLYASPVYLKNNRAPACPEELANHKCVSGSKSHMRNFWKLRKDENHQQIEVEPVMLCNEFQLLRLSLIAEMGIGPLPDFLVQKDLKEGRLVQVLPDWTIISGQVSLVWPTARHLAPRVRVFLDFMSEHFANRMSSV